MEATPKYRIKQSEGFMNLIENNENKENILISVEDPRKTYTDKSIISAGLTIFAALKELKK